MRGAALVLLLSLCACGSVQRLGPSPSGAPTATGADPATVSGRVFWPDCPTGPACPPVAGIPVHFADGGARRTFTAVSDASGRFRIQLPPGSYLEIAGDADRSPYARQIAVKAGDQVQADVAISPPTGG